MASEVYSQAADQPQRQRENRHGKRGDAHARRHWGMAWHLGAPRWLRRPHRREHRLDRVRVSAAPGTGTEVVQADETIDLLAQGETTSVTIVFTGGPGRRW